MKFRGVPVNILDALVSSVSAERYGGNLRSVSSDLGTVRRPGTNFVLRVRDSKGLGARRSSSGRRLVAACWHAHRDVMVSVFDQFPEARLTSALADYRGQEHFLATFEATGDHNVGSVMEPAAYGALCDCTDGVFRPAQRRRAVETIEIPYIPHSYLSTDAMVWSPQDSEDEIAEWRKILKKEKS